MAHLRQDQRRAMEALFEGMELLPNGLYSFREFLLDSPSGTVAAQLHFLGTSQGFGTCSRIHGVNVAVFGLTPFNQQTELLPFSHAFVLRPAMAEEMTEYQRGNEMAVAVVERLELTQTNCSKATFCLSGQRSTYVIRCM